MGNDEFFLFLGAIVGLLYSFTIFFIIFLFRKPRKPASPVKPPEKVALPSGTRDVLRSVAGLLSKTELKELRLDIEDYIADGDRREKEARDKWLEMANSLILLIDHFEDLTQGEERTNTMVWAYSKARHILEDAGIEEIPVKQGDSFNRNYHKRIDGLTQPGIIQKIIRKGYFIRGKVAEEDTILRLAEVDINKQPENKLNN